MTKTIYPVLRITILIACVIGFSPPPFAQERRVVPDFRAYGEPESSADAAKIDELVQNFKDSWTAQDVEAFIALHADDVEWINAYARMFQDADSLHVFIEQRLFPAFDSAVSRQEIENMKIVSIRYVGDDAAVIHMYTNGARGASRDEREDLRRTHVHLFLEEQLSDWKIVHTAIMDAR